MDRKGRGRMANNQPNKEKAHTNNSITEDEKKIFSMKANERDADT